MRFFRILFSYFSLSFPQAIILDGMGFYLRKSIRVGPMRFNLSKSGIGVSAGIPGLRIGSGPRGNYIHMGYGGVYYRKTLTPSKSASSHFPENEPEEILLPSDFGIVEQIDSGSVLEMKDSSSLDLLKELNEKRKKRRFWPFIGIISGIIAFNVLSSNLPGWLVFLILVLLGVLIFVSQQWDQLRKTTVLFYEFDSKNENAFESLHSAFARLKSCSKVWNVESKAEIRDRKRFAGASDVITRIPSNPSIKEPSFVKSNISVPSIPVGKQTMYFFPDRVLVYEGDHVGAVSYNDLVIDVGQTGFVEASGLPKDAKVIDYTWRYVNKKGGPDKRFKDNQKLPIALYETIHFTSNSGLNELLYVSKTDIGSYFQEAIRNLVLQ